MSKRSNETDAEYKVCIFKMSICMWLFTAVSDGWRFYEVIYYFSSMIKNKYLLLLIKLGSL